MATFLSVRVGAALSLLPPHVDGVVAKAGLEFQSLTQLLGSEELLNHVSSLLLPAARKIHRAGNPVQTCGGWP